MEARSPSRSTRTSARRQGRHHAAHHPQRAPRYVGRRLAQLTDHAQPTFDVSAGGPRWSPDGKHLWFAPAIACTRSLYDYDIAAKSYRKITKDVVVGGYPPARRLEDGVRARHADRPGEVYVQDASLPSPKRITTTNAWLADVALGASEVITWKSKDGERVEGVLLKPVGYWPARKVPLMVSAHGGPTVRTPTASRAAPAPGRRGRRAAGRCSIRIRAARRATARSGCTPISATGAAATTATS